MSEQKPLSARIKSIEDQVQQIHHCLLGDLTPDGSSGIVGSVRGHARKIDDTAVKVIEHERRIVVLEDNKRYAIAYAAGMAFVIGAIYFVLSNSVNIAKVNLNPTIQNAK